MLPSWAPHRFSHKVGGLQHHNSNYSVLLQLWIRLLDGVFGSRMAHFHSSVQKSQVPAPLAALSCGSSCSSQVLAQPTRRLPPQCDHVKSSSTLLLSACANSHHHNHHLPSFSQQKSTTRLLQLVFILCRTFSSKISYLFLILLLLLLSPPRCQCRTHQVTSQQQHTTHPLSPQQHHYHKTAHHQHHSHHHHVPSHHSVDSSLLRSQSYNVADDNENHQHLLPESIHHHSSYHHHHPHPHQLYSTTIAPVSEQSALLESALLQQHQNYLDQTLAFNQERSPSPSSQHLPASSFLYHEVLLPRRPAELAQTKCIDRCSCKWRSGKMWVECQKAELQHVPRGLDSGTQVLVLSGNPLGELEARAFERVELRNLQRLHLVSCRLHDINVDAFQQLSNLVELDLAENELTTLPTPALLHTPILRKLSLAKNRIRALKNEPFSQLKYLQAIDLSGNGIELIDPNAFYGVRDLKHLYLHENNLKSIDGKTMNDLPSVLELTLQHNPWRCDCGLRAFRDWMLERDISISYSPNCSAPMRVAGKAWSVLDLDEFACPPDVVRVDTEVVVYEGENASIGCVMAAIPNVHIEWEWRGRTIRNMSLMTFGRQMYLIRESSSPAGVVITGELLPTGATTGDREEAADERSGGAFDLTELVQEKHKGEQQQQHQQQQQHKLLLDSLIEGNNGGQKKQFISFLPLEPETFQSSARAPQQQPSMLRERRSAGSSTAANDDTYKRTSTLYIMNALEKDSGSYICVGSNKAGTVSANITLTVLRRLEVTAAAYSGEEVAGIVLGALTVFLFTFFAICFVVLRSKNGANCRSSLGGVSGGSGGNGSAANGGSTGNHHQSNGCSTTGLQATMQSGLKGGGTPANHINNNGNGTTLTNNGNGLVANGRLPNGNAQISPGGVCNGGGGAGTFRRLSNTSKSSIDTKDSKMSSSNLLISSSGGSASNSTTNTNTNSGSTLSRSYVGLLPNSSALEMEHHHRKGAAVAGALTIRTNHLAEQIELCNYGGEQQTAKDNLPTVNQAGLFSGGGELQCAGMYGAARNVPSPGSSFGSASMFGSAQGSHYLEESGCGNFKSAASSMLSDNMTTTAAATAMMASPYGSLYGGSRHYSSGSSPISSLSTSHHQSPHHYHGASSHYPLVGSSQHTGHHTDHYQAHPSCSASNRGGAGGGGGGGRHSPSPVHYGAVLPLKPLSSLAGNSNNGSYYNQADYYGHGPYDDLMAPPGGGHHLPSQEHIEQLNKRRAATSVAEELQQRMAAAGVNCTEEEGAVGKVSRSGHSAESLQQSAVQTNSGGGPVVQFANSATIYSYSPSGAVSISAKQATLSSALRRGAQGVNGQAMLAVAMAMDARDSPDEGLGEDETDGLE